MWIFADGYLTSPNGQSWKAVSGPFGRGRLSIGGYVLGEIVDVNPPGYRKGAFEDVAGNALFCPLKPISGSDRKRLGIHPDGNIPGTEGCIGITELDTRNLYLKLKRAPGESLEVK
jgi:hypothetical protein